MVDLGAIRSITNGADVMAPGLTSSVARLPFDLKPDIFVVNFNLSRSMNFSNNLSALECFCSR